MATVVLDSSVILGVLDPKDAQHQAATEAVREHSAADTLLVPATALAEVLVGASRVGSEAVRTTEAFVDAIADVVPLDRDVARLAAGLRARHRGLRMPDALVIATGLVHHASVILTADHSWRRLDPSVTVLGAPGTRRRKR